MEPQEVPAAALLMTQFRRLATLLIANDVPVEDLEHELHLVADRDHEREREDRRRRLRVVPAAG